MDSNHCLTGFEPLVLMGLEPIGDNGGNRCKKIILITLHLELFLL